MSSYSSMGLPILLVWGSLFCLLTPATAEDFTFFHENVLGTSLELRTKADTAEAASWAEERILREVDRLSAIFSGYNAASEFSRWQATSNVAIKVSPELFEVFQACDEWAARTGGAFDPRVEALTRLWSKCAKQNRTPTADELSTNKALMSRPAWRLDAQARTAERLSNCPLSLNAIAKGYIVESACNVALDRVRGIRGILLNIGGDLRVCGDLVQSIDIVDPTSDSEGADPLSRVKIQASSVATSGNSQRGYRIGSQWYSHIFDPRTGHPVENITSATVIASRAEVADALATSFNVLPVAESLRLANSLPDVQCLLVNRDGQTFRSNGWPERAKSAAQPTALAVAPSELSGQAKEQAEAKPGPGGMWNEDFELLVAFEIQRPEGAPGRYRRPYLAVWIEDKEGASVRTLILWAQKNARSQWVPDLRRWYHGDQARRLVDEFDLRKTLSRATRPPGKYDVVWDGKDDHGRQLPAGEYTVSIEAVREHGTYQSIRKRVTVANKPFVEDLKGNVEIKSATLTYRRKGQAR
ncbi:DUF2271 domain-containing protein [Singulisphaera acidiphila]|uniref:FAD:protein FMN transferase n=1 Tax=Singulisphaera acidiphila (strain ATCC BAA-1392 / DSM 18658 / VKM B-2454 / MOB10) TaxID=886293 RepID=L0DKS6_SINAD|nr:DUF2271 domain-containing protein [Singulisphaera acidiphila]AGA29979.1 membrane-associated lipoprotein involved in thiamine biosynthesis [Singulisphaera acidiphila DSM 18658]